MSGEWFSREYLYALAERDAAGAGVNKLPDLAADGVNVTFCLKEEKSSEITDIPALLEQIVTEGGIITIDAAD